MRLACPGLFSWLENGTTVVTPSRLLAAVGHQQFALDQLAKGKGSWERPRILSTGAWLTSEWTEARYRFSDTPSLLSPEQEHVLWVRIIEAEQTGVFDVNAMAEMASRAHRLSSEWQLPAQDLSWSDQLDPSAFRHWRGRFQKSCQENGWMTRADIWRKLPEWIAPGKPGGKQTVFLIQDAASPSLQAVRGALGGCARLQSLLTDKPGQKAGGKSFDGAAEEIDFAARWTRSRVESDPMQSTGVFVADLEANQRAVEQAFRSVFYPGACTALIDSRRSAEEAGHSAFHIHGGIPTASRPLAEGFLLLLQLAKISLPLADAGAILRSPWIRGSVEERGQRALADLELRRRRELDVSLDEIGSASSRCLGSAKIWGSVRRLVEGSPSTRPYSGWSKFFGDLLQTLGWPGDTDLTTGEQEMVEACRSALSDLSSLELVTGDVSLENALFEIGRLLKRGQLRNGLWAPVQIFDLRDANGLHVDHALITGMSEEAWPPANGSLPLIPWKLQREHGLPGSSPEALRTRRKNLTRSLFAVSPNVTVTWSGRRSPFADPFFSKQPSETAIWTGMTSWQSFKPAVLEEQSDEQAPPFAAGANARGGTSIIKAQSLCPFRAFAEIRLRSGSLEEGCLGLDSRERGGNLHQALQFTWEKLRSRDRLRATAPLALHELVEEAARQAVKSHQETSFGKVVTAVEVERLKEVILDWLAIERERQQPFTVETVEEERYFELAGLTLRLRMDRIDRLADGQMLLIDYKSGEQKRTKLEGARPEEPQLLVYAAGMGHEVDGVLFAQLKARDVRPVGFTRGKHFKSRTVTAKGVGWDDFLDESREEVARLAGQFKDGYAAVDPRKHACDFCKQALLCRISEQRMNSEGEE